MVGNPPGVRERRTPETTVLYRTVQAHLATFLQGIADRERALPRFCVRELEGFLRCGILSYGLARVYCELCRRDDVVAFSCKGRGFCPSCGTRRMADTALWLVERVLPAVPFRQWVLSLPYRVRLLCAYDPDACTGVRRILVRAVSGFYEKQARQQGQPRPRAGAVAWAQRFDSGLRLNLHFHVLWADGVFAHRLGGRPEFAEHCEVTDRHIAHLVRVVRDRVLRFLVRSGKWREAGAAVADDECEPEPGLELASAAVQGRTALGERAGQRDQRVGRGSCAEPFVKGPLCADVDGFSLHAAVRVAAGDRERLEKLCRYAGRPAIAENRLSQLPDGRVAYQLKRRWQDGTTHVVLEPQVLLERLCALVPRPRRHLVTYHGVFAPAAGIRPWVVPQVVEGEGDDCRHGAGAAEAGESEPEPAVAAALLARRNVPHAPGRRRRGRRRYSWAELLRHVFLIDVLVCRHCGGRRRVLAAIHNPEAIRRVLVSLGLPSDPPVVAPARGPPEPQLPWE